MATLIERLEALPVLDSLLGAEDPMAGNWAKPSGAGVESVNAVSASAGKKTATGWSTRAEKEAAAARWTAGTWNTQALAGAGVTIAALPAVGQRLTFGWETGGWVLLERAAWGWEAGLFQDVNFFGETTLLEAVAGERLWVVSSVHSVALYRKKPGGETEEVVAFDNPEANEGWVEDVPLVGYFPQGVAGTAGRLTDIAVGQVGDAPVNTAPPTLSGTPAVGAIMTVSDGSWEDAEDLSYRWQIAAPGRPWTNLAGMKAVASTYTVQARDAGRRLRCVVTGSNPNAAVEVASGSVVVSAAVAPEPPILWRGAKRADFERLSGSTDEPLIQEAPGAITDVPDPLGSGETVMRFRVNDADVKPVTPTENPRAEALTPSFLNDGAEFWLRAKVLVGDEFPSNVEGWFMWVSVYGPPMAESGPWGLFLNEDKIMWQRNFTYDFDIPWQVPRVPNTWYEIVMRQRHSETDGWVEMWWRTTDADGTSPWTRVIFFDPATSWNPNGHPATKHLRMATRDFTTNGGLNHAKILSYRQVGLLPGDVDIHLGALDVYLSDERYPREFLGERSSIEVNREFPPDTLEFIVRDGPGGPPVARWAEDAIRDEDVLGSIRLRGQVPGGRKEASGTLPRDPRAPMPDTRPWSDVDAQGAGREPVWSGRFSKAPQSDGEYVSLDSVCVGWQNALSDRRGLQIGIIDSSLGRIGEITAQRRKEVLAGGYDPNAVSTSNDPFGSGSAGNAPAGLSFNYSSLQAGKFELGELMYDSGGVDIGAVYYDFEGRPSSPDADFNTVVWLSPDGAVVGVVGTDHNALSATAQVVIGGAGLRYAGFLSSYTGAAELDPYLEHHRFSHIFVLGNHGLAPVGAWPNIGLTKKQIFPWLIPQIAPPLEVDADAIEEDGWLHQDAWYPDPGEGVDIVNDLMKTSVLDWFVKHGRRFEIRVPGTYGRRWQATIAGSEFKEDGFDPDRSWRSIKGSFVGEDGVTRYVGPPGSGCDVESPLLEITDPNHPAVQADIPREDCLQLQKVSTPERAIEACAEWLRHANELPRSGRAVLRDYLMDDRSVFRPVSQVGEGDPIMFTDSRDRSYRKIVEYDYSHGERACSIAVDAPSDALQALNERYGAALTSLGV